MNNLLDKSFQEHNHDYQIILGRQTERVLDLDPSEYPGGIAIWGALPAVFNSTKYIVEDRGVHVHARKEIGGPKQIDETFDVVRVLLVTVQGERKSFDINGIDTANYNISTILRKKLKYLKCPKCYSVHSDTGYRAVSYHTKHICEVCDHKFYDSEPSISNPVMLLKETCGDILQDRDYIDPVERVIKVKANTFKGGIQLWGSNPAVLWTSPKLEEGGIHFHGFQNDKEEPTVDETFGEVSFNNIRLDPEMVRHLMAQNALSYLSDFIKALDCPNCNLPHFDKFDNAINPHLIHMCEHCKSEFISESPCASNPLIRILEMIK